MTYLIASLWLPLLLSAVLGLGIGWWMWREATDQEGAYASSAPIIPPAPPPIDEDAPEPVKEAAPADVEEAPEPDPEPEPEPESEPVEAPSPFMAAPDGEPDKLTLIKGVGPKLGDMLNAVGVYHFTQIAGWDSDQIAEVDSQLGSFKGRITRDRWVDQARLLADRNVAAFEREFGKMNGRF